MGVRAKKASTTLSMVAAMRLAALTLGGLPETSEDEFGHWLAGFIDGEGCFHVRRIGPGKPNFVCTLRVALRDDDAGIIAEIKDRTGLGSINYMGSGSSHLNGKPQVAWTVSRKADCLALVALLDRYPLRSKKALDYDLWRLAVLRWMDMPRRNGDWSAIERLAEQISEGRQYG